MSSFKATVALYHFTLALHHSQPLGLASKGEKPLVESVWQRRYRRLKFTAIHHFFISYVLSRKWAVAGEAISYKWLCFTLKGYYSKVILFSAGNHALGSFAGYQPLDCRNHLLIFVALYFQSRSYYKFRDRKIFFHGRQTEHDKLDKKTL